VAGDRPVITPPIGPEAEPEHQVSTLGQPVDHLIELAAEPRELGRGSVTEARAV
jgi:hypothetical protein